MAEKLTTFLARHRETPEATFVGCYRHPFLVLFRDPEEDVLGSRAFETTAIRVGASLPFPAEAEATLHTLRETPKGMVTVGRAPNNDIVLKDPTISKFHAYFRRDGRTGSVTLTDAGSRNGTKVNGSRLVAGQPKLLQGGDALSFGPKYQAYYHTAATLFRFLTRLRSA